MKLTFLIILSFTLGFSTISIAQTTKTFKYTGKVQKLVIPKGVTSITVEMTGGGGGESIWEGKRYDYYVPGKGGKLSATYPVKSGETIYIYVGGKGKDAIDDIPGKGGFNGGGDGASSGADYGPYSGGGGGGASDIRIGGDGIGNRVLIVGGAGGAGSNYPDTGGDDGGHGGDLKGLDGKSGGSTDDQSCGRGGSQNSGGEGGLWETYEKAEDGRKGEGGDGPDNTSGGGGGGGYYGGGAGCWSGGGGGSSYAGPRAGNIKHEQGVNKGNGMVKISFDKGEDVAVDCSKEQVIATTTKTVICQGDLLQLFGNDADTYTWSNGVNNRASFAPPVGVHTYTVTGSSQGGECISKDSITIVVNKLEIKPTVTYNELTGLGIVDIEVEGTGLAPYTYKWKDGTKSNLGHFEGLKTGTKTLEIIDAIGCKGFTTISIEQKDPLDLNPEIHNQNYALTANTNEDQSFVTISYKGAFEFQIVDKNNRIVKNGHAEESTEVNISRLKPGKYTVQLIFKEVKEEVTFVKY